MGFVQSYLTFNQLKTEGRTSPNPNPHPNPNPGTGLSATVAQFSTLTAGDRHTRSVAELQNVDH